jgi:hypothetical protein
MLLIVSPHPEPADCGVRNPKGVGARTFGLLRIYPPGVIGSSPRFECAPKLRRVPERCDTPGPHPLRRESNVRDPADTATRGGPQRRQGWRLSDEPSSPFPVSGLRSPISHDLPGPAAIHPALSLHQPPLPKTCGFCFDRFDSLGLAAIHPAPSLHPPPLPKTCGFCFDRFDSLGPAAIHPLELPPKKHGIGLIRFDSFGLAIGWRPRLGTFRSPPRRSGRCWWCARSQPSISGFRSRKIHLDRFDPPMPF